MKVRIEGNSTDIFTSDKEYDVVLFHPMEQGDFCAGANIISDDGYEQFILIHEKGTCAHLDEESKWIIVDEVRST